MTTSIPSSPEKRYQQVLMPDGHRGGERGPLPSTPNQHPYAIKTTSTALLTRSNSTGYSASPKHVYIPITPSPSASGRHRHSKSDLACSSPRPLPTPPTNNTPVKSRGGHIHTMSEGMVFPSVRARAETLPSVSVPPPSSPVKVEDLPSNPRVWTTSQLSSYLITALRVRSGGHLPLPLPVARDIAGFVKDARLNGRSFLRLNERDLEMMGVNNLWREALLNASRNLRQNVLKGRIWGFDEDDDTNSTTTKFPYTHVFSSSSSSLEDVSESQGITPNKSSNRKGRVRGLVASLERTSSSGLSYHGSSTSEGEAVANAWADEEASFASGSEASEVEDRKARATIKKRILPEPPVDTSPFSMPAVELLPKISGAGDTFNTNSEPTVEELLASSTDSLSRSWGANAWEDPNIGETVKRIAPEQAAILESPVSPSPSSGNSSRVGSGKGSNKSTSSSKRQIKDIFSRPLPSRPLPTPPMSASSSPGGLNLIPGIPLQIVEKVDKVDVDESIRVNVNELVKNDSAKKKLEAEENEKLQTALSLLEIFRERLTEVEKRLEILERKDVEQVVLQDHNCQDTVKRNSVTKSRSVQVECMGATKPSTILVEAKSVQTNESSGPSKKPPSSIAENSINNNCDLLTPVSNKSEWRNYIPNTWDPLEKGVPSYVLMVGVGVCAVVLTTLLKRIAGKKA